MKALKTVAIVVGAVGLALTGVGAIVGLSVGASLGAAFSGGLASTLFGVSAGSMLLASGALLAIGNGLGKKPGAISGGSQTEFSADPRAGVPYAMGRTGTKGNIVFRRSSDGWSNDTPNDLMDIVTVLSGGGPINAFESFTSDKTAVTFDGGGNAIGNYHDYMFQARQLGACPEASALTVTAGISTRPTEWTTAHKLSGMAAVMWRLRFDAKQKFYQNGVPDPMWVIEAVKVYDPRQDSTYPGGSGPCRWDDESTWVWDGVDPAKPAGKNAFLHALTWCIGRHQNGKRVMGLGASLDQIVTDQFVEGANVADANGWTISGVIYSRPDTKWNNLKLILQSAAGEPLRIGAQIGCRVETPRVSLATITRDDIVGDAQLATTQSKRSRINAVIPRGRSEANNWEIVPHDPISVSAYETEDGGERTREIEWPLVDDYDQLAQLARYEIENGREFGPGTFPLKPLFLGYKPGDCLTLDIDDVASQKVLLLGREIDPAHGIVTMTVRSETDGKHAFALGQTGTPPPTASVSAYDPSVAAPAATDWSLSGGSILANNTAVPALVLTGACNNSLADAVIWEMRPYDAGNGPDDNWSAAGVDAPSLTRKEITGVNQNTQYEVGVRYRVRGVIGARRILGPVTAGIAGSAVHLIRTKTVNYPLTSDDTNIYVAAFDAVIDTGASISFGASTIDSLTAGTTYAVFWDLSTSVYVAAAYPASSEMASPNNVLVGIQTTSDAGVYPSSDPPPDGYCVADDEPILLANAARDGPGRELAAADIELGRDWVWTRHHATGEWGAFPVTAIAFEWRPVFRCSWPEGHAVRGTEWHRFEAEIGAGPGCWAYARDLGEPAGMARVAKISVSEAQTYVSGGVLSHNVKADYYVY